MSFRMLVLAMSLSLSPLAAFAHGQPPAAAHGGQVQEASENWIELVLSGDQVTVYVNDEHNMPVPSAKLVGKATVLAGGQKADVVLSPAEGNSLTGKLPAAVSGKATTVIALTIAGKATTVRFVNAG
jgi:hypothetical protein